MRRVPLTLHRQGVNDRVIAHSARRGMIRLVRAYYRSAGQCPEFASEPRLSANLSDCRRHFEDRKVHRNDDKPNHNPQEHHHRRLKQCRHRGNGLINLLFVEVCNFP